MNMLKGLKIFAWFTRRRLITLGVIILLVVVLRLFLSRPAELPLVEPTSREVIEVVV